MKVGTVLTIGHRRIRIVSNEIAEMMGKRCKKHAWVFDDGATCMECGAEAVIVAYNHNGYWEETDAGREMRKQEA